MPEIDEKRLNDLEERINYMEDTYIEGGSISIRNMLWCEFFKYPLILLAVEAFKKNDKSKSDLKNMLLKFRREHFDDFARIFKEKQSTSTADGHFEAVLVPLRRVCNEIDTLIDWTWEKEK